ncbi:unnamed protein product, partial [marine sediment metagenome]
LSAHYKKGDPADNECNKKAQFWCIAVLRKRRTDPVKGIFKSVCQAYWLLAV